LDSRRERNASKAAPDPFGLAAFTPSMGIAESSEQAELAGANEHCELLSNAA
jgi:hypothetical protein